MFAISWTEGGSVVSERRETVAGAVALANEATALKRENLTIAEIETSRAVTLEQLRQIAGTKLIGQRAYRTRVRSRRW
jgi:hypothetical protein